MLYIAGIPQQFIDLWIPPHPFTHCAGKGMTQPAPLSPPPPPPTPNPSEVKEFIALPEQFDISVDPGERTALHLAIVHCHPKVVGVLLDYKGTSLSVKIDGWCCPSGQSAGLCPDSSRTI